MFNLDKEKKDIIFNNNVLENNIVNIKNYPENDFIEINNNIFENKENYKEPIEEIIFFLI